MNKDNWQPIETAPEDGTVVWVYLAAYDGLPAFACECAFSEIAGRRQGVDTAECRQAGQPMAQCADGHLLGQCRQARYGQPKKEMQND